MIQILFVKSLKVLFIAVALSLINCKDGEEKPFVVTYEISVYSNAVTNICVIYQGADGRHTFHTDQKSWSKEVCLSPNEDMASLLVSSSDMHFDSMGEYMPIYVRVCIVYNDKKIEKMNSRLATVHLFNPSFKMK